MQKSVTSSNWPNTIGWAIYLGMSWTWVIGMVLPMIIISRWGEAGFHDFALPNVIGAALMGWFIKRRADSKAMIQHHTDAMLSFTMVTIAFHFYVLGWLVPQMLNISPAMTLVYITLVLTAAILMGKAFRLKEKLMLGLLTFAVSITIFVCMSLQGFPFGPIEQSRDNMPYDVWLLCAIMMLGFFFCPYMDLTFHRARQSLKQPFALWSFIIGFGVVFFAAIIGTYYYSNAMRWMVAVDGDQLPNKLILGLLAIYICVQGFFTVYAHAGEWKRAEQQTRIIQPSFRPWFYGICIFLLALGALTRRPLLVADYYLEEVIYLGFISFYGLIFPLYALYFLFPKNGSAAKPSKAAFLFYGKIALACWPLYGLVFIFSQYLAAIPAFILIGWGYNRVQRINSGIETKG